MCCRKVYNKSPLCLRAATKFRKVPYYFHANGGCATMAVIHYKLFRWSNKFPADF